MVENTNTTKKLLIALDFDHTVINENTDTIIENFCPNNKIPKVIEQQYQPARWTRFMQNFFNYLHSIGIKENDFKDIQQNKTTLSPGFQSFFQNLKENQQNVDIIIVSDSNTLFIDYILEKHQLKQQIKEVFTNQAYFNEQEQLTVTEHHSHDCEICLQSAINMCKKKVLEDFLSTNQVNYQTIIYVGDGGNDFCPIKSLQIKDFGFVRKGYNLEKKLLKDEGQKLKEVQCNIEFYEDATQIWQKVKNLI